MRTLFRYALVAALAMPAACSSSPVEADAVGFWGSNQAGLTISRSGGNLTLQCGTGTIDAGWVLTPTGVFSATGVTFDGGGPDPIGGRPPKPSRFTGRITGNTFRLSFTVLATNTTAGPFTMLRDGPMISQVCL